MADPLTSRRVQTDRPAQTDPDRPGAAQRQAGRNAAAQAHRAPRLRLRPAVLRGVRAGRGAARPVHRGRVGLPLQPVDRGRGRGADVHGGRLLPAERARLPQRRRRLRGRHHQPRAQGRSHRRQRAARRLRPDRRRVDRLRRREPRLRGPVRRRAQGALRGRHHRAADADEPARRARSPGKLFAIPTYVFVAGVFMHDRLGRLPRTRPRRRPCRRPPPTTRSRPSTRGSAGFALVFLLLRAFSSGCAALTGVEAISNGVPAFRKPKRKNAATTLAAMGLLAVTMFCGIIAPGHGHQRRMAENPATDLLHNGVAGRLRLRPGPGDLPGRRGGLRQRHASCSSSWPRPPRSCCSWPPTPRTTASRCSARSSPRTATCRASCTPAATGWPSPTASCCWPAPPILLVCIYGADSTRLIQLYIVGVFVSFTLSQTGMVRHWNRHLRTETDPAKRRHMVRSRAINTFGAFFTGLVLVVVLRHQVHPRRLGRPARHGDLLRHDDRDPQATTTGSPRRSPPPRARPTTACAPPGCTPIVLVSKIHSPRCAPWPTPS